MYTDMFKSFSEQAEKTFAPLVKFNKLCAKNVEELTHLQLSAARSYSELGLSQLKAATDIKNVQSLVSFNSSQIDALTRLSQQMVEDSKKFSAVAQDFKADCDALVAENVKEVAPAA